MSDPNRAPEAQSVQVDPQYIIQVLQAKVADLTSQLTMTEAYIAQQQAVIQELAGQLAQHQQPTPHEPPQHNGRVTTKKAVAKD